MCKETNEAYRVYARRKCFSNRKEVCLLKYNFKKIGSAVANLHELDVIFIADVQPVDFHKSFKYAWKI